MTHSKPVREYAPLNRLKGTPATASYNKCPSIQGYLGKYPRELRQVSKDIVMGVVCFCLKGLMGSLWLDSFRRAHIINKGVESALGRVGTPTAGASR